MRAIVAVFLIVAACSPLPDIPPSGRDDVAGFMQQVEEAERAWTRESMEALFGSEARERQSGNDRILIFYGIEIALSGSAVSRIVFTDARYISPEGLRIGFARHTVRSALGPPLQTGEEVWHYRTPRGTPIEVHWKADRINRLEWHYDRRGR